MPLTDEELLRFYRRIPNGYITQRDIDLSSDVWSYQPILYYLARSINPKVIVEIGVADGSTTMPLLKAVQETGGTLFSIDPSGCEDAHRLVKASGMEGNWQFRQMKSDEFFNGFNMTIDFAFIDGDHAYPQVVKDVRNCCQRLNKDGVVFVSDYGNYKGDDIHVKPEVFSQDKSYSAQCSNGIYKGLRLVMPEFPHLQATIIRDRVNPYVFIGTPYHGGLL